MGFVRARTKEQIISRQKEIMEACDTIFSQSGYESVNIKAIAQMTSLQRPAFYFYYKTKDEVLLDLLKREMQAWDASMQEVIDATESMTKEEFGSFLTDMLAPREKMLKLLTLLCTNIENQCSVEKLADFKRDRGGSLLTIRKGLDKFFPKVSSSNKDFFITSFMAYTFGLFPLAFPTNKQIEAMKMAGREPHPPNFRETFYRGIMLFLSDLADNQD
ncbi:MAG: TetR/AcrR family transcriptional regulator [Deltaproteobacteria bacterium]|jgi:AcrR family transcriptional regulator|nr:TetR/AcrR family transcriptional regulator [Deltaproteobacteria bacterium]